MCDIEEDLKDSKAILLMKLGEICRILLRENEKRITDRNAAFEMHCGLNLVNAMVHGRDKKVGSYALFLALLLENKQIKVRQEVVINIIEEAIRNNYNICLMKVNRHTNEVVGEGEMVLIHE